MAKKKPLKKNTNKAPKKKVVKTPKKKIIKRKRRVNVVARDGGRTPVGGMIRDNKIFRIKDNEEETENTKTPMTPGIVTRRDMGLIK